ncbi:FecR domain-containing protein [Desulfovibrio sulfodismutans]|uniref:FecR domain-containing protein n=1 Tax=Desulfolutivibrio sulfodismutans TaxID=63561 RepID=A0A7K3NHN3_9BACT|nr:FecR family protein [Desulfolutivibrio sulfodismutans]NDY55597.1 FecR domain-containing protein [Desulfolutivibrio sulfodismutans]QLA11699.1 hypothetical protein GD606_05135 [Desulfolutivibrio sulfodismutans DSM 3696]
MKTPAAACCLVFLVFFCLAANAQESGPVGHAQGVAGTVEARGPGGDARLLTPTACVYRADVLHTGKASRAQFQFLDQSLLVMDAESELALADYVYAYDNPPGKNAMIVTGSVGVFRFITGKMAQKRPESFKVQTPLLDIGVRGTDLGISATGGSGRVSVLSGGPALVTDREFGATAEVPAGQSVSKERGKAMGAPEATPPAVSDVFKNLSPAPADPQAGGGC